ncbi:Protein of unknown function (DUF1218 [Striga hermonthica]|uniref:Uncharacterized protein n=1 Tax=Striga hermonthica TaxID=68872 RepID=A0A9N7RNW0_STRHE|nr:Protein of unknown function (DUF1218 [Striga hermonthica]
MHMKSLNQYSFILFSSAIIISGLVYSALCFAAEFKKLKKNDLRSDGNLCYLPRSPAYELGFGALICLCLAQFVGNLFVCKKHFQWRWRFNRVCEVRKPSVPCLLLVFSWINFGVAIILIGVATSMSQSQAFGDGWLNGECYLVKNGVYIGSAFLGLLALGLILGSGAIVVRRVQAEEHKKVHAKIDEPTQM